MQAGTISGKTSNAYITAEIEWSSIPTTATNSSVVTATLYLRRTNSWSGTATSGTGSFAIDIGGQKGSTSAKITIPNNGSWVKAITVQKTITHNTDGKKSITISASGSISGTSVTSITCSDTVDLDNIPRMATITSAPDFTDEQNPTIEYSNLAGNAVTSLQACISFTGAKDDIAYRDISKTGTTYTFNLTNAEIEVLQSNTSGKTRTVKFYVRTTIGGIEYHSSVEKTLTIVNGNPTFTASQISYADTSMVTDTTENPQHIVQNQSNLKVTVENATAKKGATISKYDITVNGVKKSLTASGTADFGRVNSSANIPITVTVTDSRGFTTTATKNITILPWSLPTFTVSLERLNNYEDETYLTVDASISSVNNKNTMRIWYEYAERDGIYSNPTEIANNTKCTLILDKAKTYDFNIVVEDAFDYSSKQFVVDKGKFPLFIDTEKNAVGINDFPAEGEALCVAEGVARFNDGIVLLSANKKFLIKITDNGAFSITEMKEGE